jgi:hypothetical protein
MISEEKKKEKGDIEHLQQRWKKKMLEEKD